MLYIHIFVKEQIKHIRMLYFVILTVTTVKIFSFSFLFNGLRQIINQRQIHHRRSARTIRSFLGQRRHRNAYILWYFIHKHRNLYYIYLFYFFLFIRFNTNNNKSMTELRDNVNRHSLLGQTLTIEKCASHVSSTDW